jgi:serine/threonine-protein phosphatase 2B regulatory subunit
MIEKSQNKIIFFRVISIFDKSGDGQVDFREFIQSLSVFSAKGSAEDKLRFAFQVKKISTYKSIK